MSVAYSVTEDVASVGISDTLGKTPVARKERKRPNCIVCMDRSPNVVLVPCGHQNLCSRCAHKWKDSPQSEGGGCCPTDRRHIDKIVMLVPL